MNLVELWFNRGSVILSLICFGLMRKNLWMWCPITVTILVNQADKVNTRQASTFSGLQEDKASLTTLSASDKPISSAYSELLKKLEDETPVFLNDYAPSDRYQRRRWMSNLKIPIKVMVHMGIIWVRFCFAGKFLMLRMKVELAEFFLNLPNECPTTWLEQCAEIFLIKIIIIVSLKFLKCF